MSYHPRIESKDHTSFTTSRCRNSELWFVNNKNLESRILAYLAKYTTIYEVVLYGFAIEGNHLQMEADFPKENRAEFNIQSYVFSKRLVLHHWFNSEVWGSE